MFYRVQRNFSQWLESFFAPPEKPVNKWLTWGWIAALYAGGVYLWILFFNKGNIPFDFHDWADITGPRFTFLKDAVTRGVLPLFVSGTSTLGGITHRYLSIPDAFVSPQMVLLRFLSVGMFVLVNQVLMYTLGFGGLLWFKRRFSLSPAAFTILFLMFNFNGHVLAHFSVGHDTWGGYFLFPWFVALTIKLIEGDKSWSWVAKMSLLMLAIFLQGSFHQYVWALIFLGVLAITSWKHFLTAYKAVIFSVLLAMVRILPPTLLMGRFDNFYMGGYSTLADIWDSMINIKIPGVYVYNPDMAWPLGTWEFSLYVGLIGAAFILFFGVFRWLGRKKPEVIPYRSLVFPIATLVILSVGQIYRIVRLAPIGIVEGERVSSRMISIPFVFLLILGVIEFQKWLNEHRLTTPAYLGQLALLFLASHDLYQNFTTWTVTTSYAHFTHSPFIASAWYAVSRVDIPYQMTLEWGLAVSVVSLVVLMTLVLVEKKQITVRVTPLADLLPRWRDGQGSMIPPTGKNYYASVDEDSNEEDRDLSEMKPRYVQRKSHSGD